MLPQFCRSLTWPSSTLDLQEEVVDVGVVAVGRSDDRDLARERVGAADAVDLAWIGRAHDPQEQESSRVGRIGGQVVAHEERALRRAAAHQHAADSVRAHPDILAETPCRERIGLDLAPMCERGRRGRTWSSMDATSPRSSDQDTERFVVVDAVLDGGSSRFELHRDGELVGWATYRREDDTVVIPHVETLVEYRGQGFADRLMAGIVGNVRGSGRTIMPLCSFAAGYLRDHPEHDDVAVTPCRP